MNRPQNRRFKKPHSNNNNNNNRRRHNNNNHGGGININNVKQQYEKYNTLALNSQSSGDRVQSEYYSQYAEHYNRVLMTEEERLQTVADMRRKEQEARQQEQQSQQQQEAPQQQSQQQQEAPQQDIDNTLPAKSAVSGSAPEAIVAQSGSSD